MTTKTGNKNTKNNNFSTKLRYGAKMPNVNSGRLVPSHKDLYFKEMHITQNKLNYPLSVQKCIYRSNLTGAFFANNKNFPDLAPPYTSP